MVIRCPTPLLSFFFALNTNQPDPGLRRGSEMGAGTRPTLLTPENRTTARTLNPRSRRHRDWVPRAFCTSCNEKFLPPDNRG
jgi:hypothetical protein